MALSPAFCFLETGGRLGDGEAGLLERLLPDAFGHLAQRTHKRSPQILFAAKATIARDLLQGSVRLHEIASRRLKAKNLDGLCRRATTFSR